ncbi:MAG: DUF2184 domain-containing protein [Oscillospiraceae bacterium]|jgi:hypothetical protein|nr:DUF2184 domain-containing protein [Oscillospiraceae bacterium]
MNKYQNVGTYDAGIITAPGTAPGGAMTMDAAGIASGQAFLVSELEKRDTLIRKPLTSVTYPRDIVVRSGGGWVDYVSAHSVGYGITGGSGSGVIQAGGANGLPIVQANMEKGLYKAHAFAAALRVMWVDMQKANFAGRSLDQMLQDGMRLAYDKHMDQNVYTGIPEYGSWGLVNHPDVTETAVTGGAWSGKSKEKILADVNNAVTTVWEAAEYDEDAMPNHILLPYAQYTYILHTPVTELATETILDYVMKNNVAAKNGKSLYIGAARWCKGAGTDGLDRMVVYVNHERFLQVEELVPLTRAMSQPNAADFCYDTAYAANLSEVELFYPQTMMYFDGI